MEYFKNLGFDVGKGRYHEEAVYGVALLFNLINTEINNYLKDFDLTSAKFNVLMTIKHLGGPQGISQVEISRKLIVTASNMTRLLDKLEKEKFVHRVAQEGDRRINIIKVSEKASRLLDEVWPGYQKTLQQLISQLDENEQKGISQLLLKWFSRLINKEG